MTRRPDHPVGDGERGQASVEVIGMVPLVLVVALGVAQLLAAGGARELAGHAAEAGAVAMSEGADPARAARDSLPGWGRGRVAVRVEGRRVRVRVRPIAILPGAAGSLASEVIADAGPTP